MGVARERLRDRSLLDVVTAADSAAVEQLTDALLHRRHGRFPLDVRWTARGHANSGHLTVELVDEALLGERPLLVFLHVNHPEPERHPPVTLEPVAARILELVASGVTTSVVARQVGLTVDGVNYHLGRLCRRLDAPNRVALVARAYVLGLLDPTVWPPDTAADKRQSDVIAVAAATYGPATNDVPGFRPAHTAHRCRPDPARRPLVEHVGRVVRNPPTSKKSTIGWDRVHRYAPSRCQSLVGDFDRDAEFDVLDDPGVPGKLTIAWAVTAALREEQIAVEGGGKAKPRCTARALSSAMVWPSQ